MLYSTDSLVYFSILILACLLVFWVVDHVPHFAPAVHRVHHASAHIYVPSHHTTPHDTFTAPLNRIRAHNNRLSTVSRLSVISFLICVPLTPLNRHRTQKQTPCIAPTPRAMPKQANRIRIIYRNVVARVLVSPSFDLSRFHVLLTSTRVSSSNQAMLPASPRNSAWAASCSVQMPTFLIRRLRTVRSSRTSRAKASYICRTR
jgi:hypothetical protein